MNDSSGEDESMVRGRVGRRNKTYCGLGLLQVSLALTALLLLITLVANVQSMQREAKLEHLLTTLVQAQGGIKSAAALADVTGAARTATDAHTLVRPKGSFGELSTASALRRVLNLRNGLVPDVCLRSEKLLGDDTPPGSLILDVGANDGTEAVAFGQRGMRVFTFEATPGKLANIKHNIETAGLTQLVTLVHAAVSNYTGTAEFVVHDGAAGSEQDSMAVPWADGVKTKVPVVQLDDYVKEGERVALLKSDTQGHEVQVMMGAHRLLSEHRIDLIHAEFSPGLMEANLGGGSAQVMLDLLYSYGYRCMDCPEPNGPPSTRPSDFTEFTNSFGSFIHRGADHKQWTDVVCF